MWALFQTLRRQTKLGFSLFVWDLLFLVVVMMVTSAITKQVMHPAISIIGTLWVLATAAAIWHLGGVEGDSLIFARMLGVEQGKEFTRALNVFFILGSTTVIFFFLFPAWKFWAGTILLPVLLVAIFTCANMAERKTNWNLFFWIFASIAGAILAAIVIAGLTGWTTENGAALIQRPWFQSWIERLLLLGLIFLGISFIPKMPKDMLRIGAGLAIIISVILLVFPEIQPSNLGLNQSAKETKAFAHKSLSPDSKTLATVAESPLPLVPTGITMQPGEKLLITKTASLPYVVLVMKSPDGGKRRLSANFWRGDQLAYSHTGQMAKGPVEIFYRGEKGNYNFRKVSPEISISPVSSVSQAKATSTAYYPPPASGKQPVSKEECPFE